MLHPGPAAIDCETCRRWIVDFDRAQIETVRVGPSRTEVPQPRPAGIPTPCATCAKQNPENAEQLKLSRKNEQTYRLWQRARATFGHAIPDHLKHDPLLAHHFAQLDQLHASIDQVRQQQLMMRFTK